MCKILAAHEVKPHKVRYYLERRDPEFEPKWPKCFASIVRSRCGGRSRIEPRGSPRSRSSPISYDEKPGIQAIGTVAANLRPVPGTHATISPRSRV
jgi:hypothetical protein